MAKKSLMPNTRSPATGGQVCYTLLVLIEIEGAKLE
jgi:hypothetical protein